MSSVNVTSSVTKESASTSVGSINYLKGIIPAAVFNIIYNRITYPETCFDSYFYKKCEYKNMSATNQHTNPLCNIHLALKGAMNTLEERNISDVVLIIHKKDNNEVIEFYKFSLQYNDDNLDNTITVGNTKLESKTVKFLEKIKVFGNFPKLQMEEICLEIQLLLKKGSTGYTIPKMFEYCNRIKGLDDREAHVRIENVNLGSHKMKLFAKGSIYDTFISDMDKNKEVEKSKSDVDEPTEKKRKMDFEDESYAGTSIHLDEEEMVYDESIDCACRIKYKINSIGMIECTKCHHFEHLACVGIRGDTDQTIEDYICFLCRYEKKIEGLDSNERRKYSKDFVNSYVLKIIRLLIEYCSDETKNPSRIYRKVDARYIKDLNTKLNLHNLLKVISGENVVISDHLRQPKLIDLFFKGKLDDSLTPNISLEHDN